jgi:hypothetical protein
MKKLNKAEKLQNKYLKQKYGIDLTDYWFMHAQQQGHCGICRQKKTLYVDHNHQTGKVRALLCNKCNSGLGFFNEDILQLKAAIDYLLNTN